MSSSCASRAIPLASSIVGIENVLGSPFDDVIYGDGGANRIEGGPGADYLDGRGGVDIADGGAATDTCSAEARIRCELSPYDLDRARIVYRHR